MKLSCRIKTDAQHGKIEQLFATELQRKYPRSSVRLSDEGNAVFNITAEDVTALRATVNGITSILSIYEKTKKAYESRS